MGYMEVRQGMRQEDIAKRNIIFHWLLKEEDSLKILGAQVWLRGK